MSVDWNPSAQRHWYATGSVEREGDGADEAVGVTQPRRCDPRDVHLPVDAHPEEDLHDREQRPPRSRTTPSVAAWT